MNLESLVLGYFHASIFYYMSVNVFYVFLLVAAAISIRNQRKLTVLVEHMKNRSTVFAPPISVLAPAYNEERSIVDSVRSLLMLVYPKYEVIVINDGSIDGTLGRLQEAFDLVPELLPIDPSLSKTLVKQIYRSRTSENLIVVDKENGGKADALNVGIGVASHELFCAVDSDSILEEEALFRAALPFIDDPSRTIAVGGTIRVANGCTIRRSRIEKVRLPTDPVSLIQVVEYIRAFLCGRTGWNVLNATLVISGAFGVFKRKAVMEVGGYLHQSIGEDMELVVRLHRKFREEKRDYRVVFIPDPVCWTEVPSDLATLGRQRNRWQRGLADTLLQNRSFFMNPKYGTLGTVAFPYFLLVELFGPVFELISYAVLITAWAIGILDLDLLWLFFLAGVFYGALMSVAAVLLEEHYFSRYSRVRDVTILALVGIVESFGWRQITSVWRLAGLYDFIRGKRAWGAMNRKGFSKA